MRLARMALVMATVASLAACKSSMRELEPTPPERTDMTPVVRTIPPHEPLPGSTATTALIFSQDLPGLSARLEVREYYLGEGHDLTITAPSEALFEVRSGRFDVTAPNEKGARSSGQMWTIQPGERVVVRTTSEMAILRATYIVTHSAQ